MELKIDNVLAFGFSFIFAVSAGAGGVALLERVALADDVTKGVTYGLGVVSSIYAANLADRQYDSCKSSLFGAVVGYGTGVVGTMILFAPDKAPDDVSLAPERSQAAVVQQHSPSAQSSEFLDKYSIA